MSHIEAIRVTIRDLGRDEAVQVLEFGRSWAASVLRAGGLSRAERKYWSEAKAAYEAFLSE